MKITMSYVLFNLYNTNYSFVHFTDTLSKTIPIMKMFCHVASGAIFVLVIRAQTKRGHTERAEAVAHGSWEGLLLLESPVLERIPPR